MANELEEGQIVLCTVDKILGTTVFVKIEGNGEGTITTSEIAPGRIRNLRDYVVPGKKIVCKILRIGGDRIQLSLRRVKQQEKRELLEKLAKEKSYKAILKTVLGKEKSEESIEKIQEDYTLTDFFTKIKEDKKILEKYLEKEQSEKIIQILESKKEKEKEVKQIFRLSSKSPEGIKIVKDIILDACKETKCRVNYLAAGKYSIKIKGENFRELKTNLHKFLEDIEKQSKKKNCEFSIEKS
jgi:translation initiation factor 2 alpha subunit (eIF-2alpha)